METKSVLQKLNDLQNKTKLVSWHLIRYLNLFFNIFSMTITELKSSIKIEEVANFLGMHLNSQDKTTCPFHADKTPSLQFSKDKQIATCFSSNCTAGTMDVIDLVSKHENLSTHEAINWLTSNFSLQTNALPLKQKQMQTNFSPAKRKQILQELFAGFERSFIASKPARNYLEGRNIAHKRFRVG